MAIRNDVLVGLTEGFGLVDFGWEGEEEALACIALNSRTRGKVCSSSRGFDLFSFLLLTRLG